MISMLSPPVIARRIGQKEIIGEESILQLVQQLMQIINKFAATELNGDKLMKSYNDIGDGKVYFQCMVF